MKIETLVFILLYPIYSHGEELSVSKYEGNSNYNIEIKQKPEMSKTMENQSLYLKTPNEQIVITPTNQEKESFLKKEGYNLNKAYLLSKPKSEEEEAILGEKKKKMPFYKEYPYPEIKNTLKAIKKKRLWYTINF